MIRFSRSPWWRGLPAAACSIGLMVATPRPVRAAGDGPAEAKPLPNGGQKALHVFSNITPIPIPASGPASLYPSTIPVSAIPGSIADLHVVIRDLTHTFPDDLDVLLVSPAGTKVILHSDAGGGTDVSEFSYVIHDLSGYPDIPDDGPLVDVNMRNRDYESPPDESFPAPAPPGPYYVSTSAFKGENPNGTWSLYVRDDNAAGGAGAIEGGWVLRISANDADAATTIQDNGPATPYPHDITVLDVPGRITKVRVRLGGLSHTFPDDIDVLLQGPGGGTVLLMSDVGGGSDLAGVTLTFDDAASASLPDDSQIAAGAYRPTNFDTTSDVFPGPVPPGPYGNTLSVFNNVSPRGAWRLFVRDDKGQDVGSINNWGVFISTTDQGDFNLDSSVDLLWRHDVSGENVLWYMNGNALRTGEFTSPSVLTDVRWKMVGTHDFNGDNRTDILWRHATSGENVLWFMERNTLVSGTFTSPSALADVNWQMVGTGDFNQDARPDIFWRHDVSGQSVVWFMNGAALASGTFTNPPDLFDLPWKIVATGHFNIDKHLDILLWHPVTGDLEVALMNGLSRIGGGLTTPSGLADTGWRPVAAADIDRDNQVDIIWRHQGSGQNVVWYMDGLTLTSGEFLDPPVFADTRWKIVGPR